VNFTLKLGSWNRKELFEMHESEGRCDLGGGAAN
jgi:hypothetical protein